MDVPKMASNININIDQLLEPISEDNPVGSDLREDQKPDSIYQQIKQARMSARAAERNNMYDQSNNEAIDHWRNISVLAPEIISKHSKDLEISSWYIEAVVRLYGFHGLKECFKLTRELIETYWDSLYPQPDEDGMLIRVAPLAGLNGEGAEGVLMAPIRNIAITQGEQPGPFSLWQYQQALDIQKITDPETRSENFARIGFSIDDIEAAVSSSSETFYIDLRNDINECIKEYKQISKLLDERCETHEAPPTSNMIAVLEQCLGAVNHLGRNKFPIEEANDMESDTGDDTATSSASPKASAVTSREAAFQQLYVISEFFKKTEPHSPISYILAKAVKWGNMPLNELIGELIPDDSSREYYSSLTGVNFNDET